MGFNLLMNGTLGIQSPCQMMIGVYNHFLRKVFEFHYHSQGVIGSIGGYIGVKSLIYYPLILTSWDIHK